jgi:TonB family protein
MALHYEKPSGSTPSPPRTDVPAAPIRAVIPRHNALDDTLPPTPLRELLASSGASAWVLTTDAAFVDVIVQAAGAEYPLSVVESWSELHAAVDAGQCGIALLDAALLGDRAIECIAALAPYAHRLVTLVAADRATASEFVGLLADRRIHRLLMKPAAVGATRLLIESAVTRRMALRDLHRDDEAIEVAGHAVTARNGRWRVPVAAAVGLLFVGAAVAWALWRGGAVEPTPDAAPIQAVDPAAELRQRIEGLRAQAELARTEGRLSDPLGTGALEHYLAILELAPDDAPARNGVVLVVESLFTRAEQGLLAGSLDEVAATLDQVRRVQPTSTRLAFLDAQLVRALAASVAAPPTPPPQPVPASVAAAPTEIDSLLSLAAARLLRGQLLGPAGDNARDYLDRARTLDPTNARAAALRADLATALVTAAWSAAASDLAAAGALADEARRQAGETSGLAALEQELAAASARVVQRQSEASLVAARELVRQGVLFAPPGNHALAMLLRVQGDAPDTEGLAGAWSEFRVATRGAIEAAAASADSPTVEAGLAALREAPDGAAIAEQLVGELAARRLQEQYLAEVIPASQLRLLAAPEATYPQEAIDANLEGWVDLEFIVDPTGKPRDGVVIDARPRGRFDATALAAVAAYRYAPFELDGRIYERRVRLRLRFVIR